MNTSLKITTRICRSILVVATGLGLAGVSAATAAEGWYGGVSFGQSKADINCDLDVTCSADDKDTGWKLLFGNQFTKNFGVEFGYVDLGEFKVNGIDTVDGTVDTKYAASGFNLAAVGSMPVSNAISLIGKLGLFRWDLDASGTSSILGSASTSKSGTDLMYGIGASIGMGKNTDVRVEWEVFKDIGDKDVTGESDIDLLSVGLVFRF